MRTLLLVLGQAGRQPLELRRPAADASPEVILGSGADCGLQLTLPGIQPRHLRFTWNPREATWHLSNLAGPGLVHVNGAPLPPGRILPLPMQGVEIALGGRALEYACHPDPPTLGGEVVAEIRLGSAPLVLGRPGEPGAEGEGESRLELDADIGFIAPRQAIIRKEGREFLVENLQTESRFATLLNGNQSFAPTGLVFGDRIQIPGVDDYTFLYTGGRIAHYGTRGWVQARQISVDVPGKRILHDVDLDIRPSSFVGILGGSGQGKSTMMRALCGVAPPTAGEVRLDGRSRGGGGRDEADVGFVPQDDIVHADLRVRSALVHAARLRLALGRREIDALVSRTLERLQLTDHASTRIRSLSGGQRKRVSIACELLSVPSILFLDEPTSGLDPAIEGELMNLLRNLADSGVTVVSTTHVLVNAHVFDKLVFIHGGHLVFDGSPSAAAEYFVDDDFPPKTQRDPEDEEGEASGQEAPRKVQLLTALHRSYNILSESQLQPRELAESYKESTFAHPPLQLREDTASGASPARATRPGPIRQLLVLLRRQLEITLARPLNVVFLLMQALIIGFLIGWVSDNLMLQLFLAVIASLWFGTSNGAQQIVGELPIFRRERVSGLGVGTYLSGKALYLFGLTTAQAVILFAVLLFSNSLFHPDTVEVPTGEDLVKRLNAQPPMEDVKAAMERKLKGESSRPIPAIYWQILPAGDDFPDLVYAEDQPNRPLIFNYTYEPGQPRGLLLQALRWTAGLLRVESNLLDANDAWRRDALRPLIEADVARFLESGRMGEAAGSSIPSPPLGGIVVSFWALRMGALLMAALVGVMLGLAISSAVDTDVQAAMWVPLILIPQILFGGFVVILPDMEAVTRQVSRLTPSYHAQRIMETSAIYGMRVPRIANESRVPAFAQTAEQMFEKVEWTGADGSSRSEDYDRGSDRLTAWQNLLIIPSVVGQRMMERELVEGPGYHYEQKRQAVESRRDVLLSKGTAYRRLAPVREAFAALGIWSIACYGFAFILLRRRQTER